MLHLANITLHMAHLLIIAACLFGWIPVRTRQAHLFLVTAISGCWFMLGLRFGIGYCPLTDLHWQVKRQLGESTLPNSHIKYCWDHICPSPIPLSTANALTFAAFFVSLFISLYLNWAARKKTTAT